MYLALALMTLLFVLLSLLPLWRCETWWVRCLDFPRLQFTLLVALLLAAQLSFLEWSHPGTWILVLVSLALLIYQAWWIIPYTPLFPVEVQSTTEQDPENSIRVMTANVLTPNRNADGLIQLVRDNQPDVMVTLESDQWWQDRLGVLEQDYPHTIKCPQDNLYGMHVYSRYELSNAEIEFLVEADVPSMHALVAMPSGRQVRMHFLHPAPPSPTENEASSERDAELVLVARSVADSDQPVIVTGDLNDVAWSATTRLFRRISGLLDPRIGRGMLNSFHADYWPIRWPLDHLFHSRGFTLTSIKRLPAFGSDHFAILTELCYCADQAQNRPGLRADGDDQRWAREKIDATGADKDAVPEPEKSD